MLYKYRSVIFGDWLYRESNNKKRLWTEAVTDAQVRTKHGGETHITLWVDNSSDDTDYALFKIIDEAYICNGGRPVYTIKNGKELVHK